MISSLGLSRRASTDQKWSEEVDEEAERARSQEHAASAGLGRAATAWCGTDYFRLK